MTRNNKQHFAVQILAFLILIVLLAAFPNVEHAQTPTATRTGTPCAGPGTTVPGCIGGTLTIATANAARTQTAQALTSAPSQAATVATQVLPISSLKAQYKAADTVAGDNQIKPHFNIFNATSVSVALSEVKLRYYFTKEAGGSPVFTCDWAVKGCGNITSTFGTISPAVTGADSYLEIGFSTGAGSLAPGQSTGDIQARINKSDWTNFNESDDYSFDPTKTAYADWNKVTLYRLGTLVWGTPAGGSVPTNTPTVVTATPITPTVGGSLPDLTITNIALNNYDPCKPGVPIRVTVANQGTANAGSFVVAAQTITMNTMPTQTINGLAAGQSTTADLLLPGFGTVQALADTTLLVTESNENNNTLTTTIPAIGAPCVPSLTPTTNPGGLPDLVVTSVSYNTPEIQCKVSDGKAVRVVNQGTTAAGSFVVRLTLQGSTPVEQTVSGLGVGQVIVLNFIGYGGQGGVYAATADATSLVAESNETNNTLSTQLPVLTQPIPCTPGPTNTFTPTSPAGPLSDLIIRYTWDMRVGYSCVSSNNVTLVTVANTGDAPAGAFIVRASNGNAQEDRQILGLGARQSVDVYFGIGSTATSALTVTADPANLIIEINETNNTRTLAASPSTPPPPCTPTPGTPSVSLPDLTVTNLTNAPPTTGCGTNMGTNVTVANVGATNAGAFNVSLSPVGQSTFTQSVTGLAAGQSITLRFSPNGGNFTATADSGNVITESNETNNSMSKILPVGDPLPCTWTPTPTGSATATPTPSPTTPVACPVARCINVNITDSGFQPASVFFISDRETQIRWTNIGSMSHTVTFDSSNQSLLNSGTIAPGQSHTANFTVNLTASYSYHCNFHASMTGSINISQPTPFPTVITNTPTTPTATFTPTRTNTPGTPTLTPTRTNTPANGLSVQIKGNGTDNNQQTAFSYAVRNTGTSAVSGVTVRVYFTVDGSNPASNYTLEKYYDQSGVATISGPTAHAAGMYYFTVNYGTASLPAGGQWELQTALHLANWGTTFNGATDWFHTGYAAGALPAAYTNTTYIPAFVNGTLVWGLIPPVP